MLLNVTSSVNWLVPNFPRAHSLFQISLSWRKTLLPPRFAWGRRVLLNVGGMNIFFVNKLTCLPSRSLRMWPPRANVSDWDENVELQGTPPALVQLALDRLTHRTDSLWKKCSACSKRENAEFTRNGYAVVIFYCIPRARARRMWPRAFHGVSEANAMLCKINNFVSTHA